MSQVTEDLSLLPHPVKLLDGIRSLRQKAKFYNQMEEVFIRQVYGWLYRRIVPNTVVIDIGMNVGLSALYFTTNELVNVISFEPFRPTYSQAMENFSLNPNLRGRIDARNYGLGAADSGTTWDYLPEMRGSCGAFSHPDVLQNAKTQREMVIMRRASDVVAEIARKLNGADLVAKIDCEGAEYEIIADLAATGVLKAISGLMIEWHCRGAHEPCELVRLLTEQSFNVILQGRPQKQYGMLYATRR